MNVSDKNVGLNGGEVGGNVEVVSTGSITVSGDINVSGGTFAVVSEGSSAVSGNINVSGGNVTLENTKVDQNITYTGGKLRLSGITSVFRKITMSPALAISVKNLQDSGGAKVASLASSDGFDSWQKGTAVLESAEGHTSSMSEICRFFTIDSSKWILVQGTGSDQNKGALGASGVSVEIENYEVGFVSSLSEINSSTGRTPAITPVVKIKDGKEFEASDSDFSNWKISLSYQGKDLQSESDKKIIFQENFAGRNLYICGFRDVYKEFIMKIL